jgi:hypothetical protein
MANVMFISAKFAGSPIGMELAVCVAGMAGIAGKSGSV